MKEQPEGLLFHNGLKFYNVVQAQRKEEICVQ